MTISVSSVLATTDPPRLRGSRCVACATVVFPVARSCPRCSATDLDDHTLPTTGTLWSFTTQTFAPKAPYVVPSEGFAPFGVGYVDLGEVLVEARLDADPGALRIGIPMRLVATDGPAGYAFTLDTASPTGPPAGAGEDD